MSQRHSDGRHLMKKPSLPLRMDSEPSLSGRDSGENLYSNYYPRETTGAESPNGLKGAETTFGGRQRAMSEAAKIKASKKPMPAPKPAGLSTVKDPLPLNRTRSSSDDSPQQPLEENLYEEAFSSRKERHSNNEILQSQLEGIYAEPIAVAGHLLPFAERKVSTINSSPEPIYDEASVVCVNKVPAQKSVSNPGKYKNDDGENLYEDAATVSLSKLHLDVYGSISKNSKIPEDPIYCEAAPVMSSRLSKDEKHESQKLPKGNCIYEDAAEVIKGNGVDSSDDEEPLYFNLLLLQKSIGSQKLWNSRADPHMGRVKVEQNARRHSAFKVLPVPPPKRPGLFGSETEDSSSKKGASGQLSRYQSLDEEWSDDLIGLRPCDETEMKKMRKWIISDILKSEKSYCELLELLVYYMNTLKCQTNLGVISLKDIETIFYGIQELCNIHSEFVKNLQPVVEKSSKDCQVGRILKEMVVNEYHIAEEYLKRHHEAINTVQRCCTESAQFAELTKAMKYRQLETNLEDLLRKPIERFQCNALVLHDLKNCTPTSHADFDLILKTLRIAKNFLDICSGSSNSNVEDSRYLVKNGIVVEKPDKDRKLRHIFLFNDILVCCKQKISNARNQRLTYEVKWYIPLCDLTLEDKFSAQEEKQAAIRNQEEISGHKKELVKLQRELKDEVRKLKAADGQISVHHRQIKPLESIRKKLAEQEAKLVVGSPHLPLKLFNRANQKTFTLLMASDYERTNWKSSISGLIGKANQTPAKLSLPDVINLINSQRIPKLLGSALDGNDTLLEEERLNGCLAVTIHKLHGLKEDADAFCSVEVDSFGHFFMKAKTNRAKGRELVWNEDFDIDLEGAQSMHILCYKIGQQTDSLLGKCSLVLHKEWITEDFQDKAISLGNELLLSISLKYTSPESVKRSSSSVKSDVFGVKLERILKKEGKQVPLIVTACVEEIEKRGLKDVGIYRVSGLSAEIQRHKKAFNKNSSEGAAGLAGVDTNVLSGLLKLFFRELPEALFTDSGYPEFVKGIGLSDPDTKERFLVSQLSTLPPYNYATILYLLNHLVRVAQYEESNKMCLMNLATVFGPTLLRPSEKDQKTAGTESLFCQGASEVVLQSTILLYFLNLKAKNYDFPRPKSNKAEK